MFREGPVECCQYRVFDEAGQELPAENWLLQRVYDGNPVGYGVGVVTPAVIEQEFGDVHDEAAVRRHVGRQFGRAENRGLGSVWVEQTLLGAVDGQQVGVFDEKRWLIRLPAAGDG